MTGFRFPARAFRARTFIAEDYEMKTEENYWVVGAMWGGWDDQHDEFVRDGVGISGGKTPINRGRRP